MTHNLTDVIPYDDICFIDSETRTILGSDPIKGDITETSVRVYAEHAYPIIVTYAFGLTGPVKRWVTPDIHDPMAFLRTCPPELRAWKGYFAAWNSAFDRHLLGAELDAMDIDAWLDMMAQAAYNNMPLGLDRAAKSTGYEGKQTNGKKLIDLFCRPDGATPQSRPVEWEQFCSYADIDVEQMQLFCQSSVPVPFSIWEEFWVSEAVNDRGLPFDRKMAEGGAALAEVLKERTNEDVKRITKGAMHSVRQYAVAPQWCFDRLDELPSVQALPVAAERQLQDGTIQRKFKMDRPIIARMIAGLEQANEEQGLTDAEHDVLEFLYVREFGASAAPAKFEKMLAMATREDRVPGQYVFSGATQTGRYSSRGVQVHNMTRSAVGGIEREDEVARAITEGTPYDTFAERFGNVGKTLSLMIRPTICAEPGKLLVWGDWSSIEAVGLPWLAKAEHRLDVFREIQADPKSPDVYLRAVAGMYSYDAQDLQRRKNEGDGEVKKLRQRGKIAELSLGFNGGPGALQSMAANYGMQFEASEAKEIVDRWRAANGWAVDFWAEVWDAFLRAYNDPGTPYPAGRVVYQGVQMGKDRWVVCYMPDGRPLFYRKVRQREVKEYDPFDPSIVLSSEMKLSFEGEGGVKYLWPGLLVENITQGICASILRQALIRVEAEPLLELIGHTHDEIITQVDEADEERAQKRLAEIMIEPLDWYDGIPLGVDTDAWGWYTKALEE
jgi:DNA polymerase